METRKGPSSRFVGRALLSVAGLAPAIAGTVLYAASSLQRSSGPYETRALPLLKKYCWTCHSGATAPAGLKLGSFATQKALLENREVFEGVAERLKSGTMPPPGAPQPSAEQRKSMLDAIQSVFAKAPPATIDPGRPTLRRLNRAEYDNTVRDLFGIDFRPADDFPSDDVGYGFDNIGDVLSLSPLLIEKYMNAAEQVAAKAVVLPETNERTFGPEVLQTDSGNNRGEHIGLFTNGRVWVEPELRAAGLYKLRIVAFATQSGPENAKMAVRVDAKDLQVLEVLATEKQPLTYELPPFELQAGKHRFAAAFINDHYEPQNPDPQRKDRNLFVREIQVIGPIGARPDLPASHRRIMIATPDPANPAPAARAILSAFLQRAFRRPPTKEELDRYAALTELARKDGKPFEAGLRLAIQAALVSPHFLFRVELDEPAVGSAGAAKGSTAPRTAPVVRDLGPFEVASRLSYFLWSSMPDDRLFELAGQGKLNGPEAIKREAARMLASPKARALTENFASQWLTLRKLDLVSPDPELFPEWSEALRKAMRAETELFFENVVKQDRPVTDFLDADYTFLNETLARHYGIPGVTGPDFRRVTLPGSRRGGVVTHASLMTLTSNPNRTSPVKRGKWVLENILGTPPPPPPPGLDSLAEGDAKAPTRTIKERMAAHRAKPDCAVCHARMDPVGFSLENFDPVGKWRDKDGRFPIDASDSLPDGTRLNGPSSLRSLLVKRKQDFVRTLSEKLLTYAIGRGLEPRDKPAVDRILTHAQRSGYKFSALIDGVVASDPFRKRRIGP